MSLESFYHTGIYSDIVLVTRDGIRKQLHKIISKSHLFDELVKNKITYRLEIGYILSHLYHICIRVFLFLITKFITEPSKNIIPTENILNSAVYLGAD